MFDILFVNGSHPLSPYIYSLNSKFGHLPDKERNEIKEKLDPSASGGMNGYISLCSGDSCPPVFRSPVDGLEDIMDNQVICSIYKLPDLHKHIARPPVGVIIPKKTVEASDLKPPPVLWHEDSGRRPHDNSNRQNPPGAISGRQLGEAAHRLVINSINVQGRGQHSAPSMPYQTIMNGMHHLNVMHPIGNQGMPSQVQQAAGRPGWYVPRGNVPNGQVPAYVSSGSGHYQYERSGPSRYEQGNRGRQQSHPYARDRVPPAYGYQQTGGSMYSSQPAAPPSGPGLYGQPYGGGYQPRPYGGQQWQQQPYGSYTGRGPYGGGAHPTRPDSRSHQPQNRYGALDRSSSRRPPSGYGR
uniref:5'->3' exoribonuclease, putative n=1 Tax=Arundo donax TaxID=35708 RepID=A0A0A9D434_ARUDO